MLMQTQFRAVSANQLHSNTIPRPAPVRGGFGAIEATGSQMRFGANEEIFGEAEPAPTPRSSCLFVRGRR
jgi:hypothetical protein